MKLFILLVGRATVLHNGAYNLSRKAADRLSSPGSYGARVLSFYSHISYRNEQEDLYKIQIPDLVALKKTH